MGSYDPNASRSGSEGNANIQSTSATGDESEGDAFHSQFEYFAHPQPQSGRNVSTYGQQSFDMASMASALSQAGPHTVTTQSQYGATDSLGVLSPALVYQMQQASQYPIRQGSQFDPMNVTRSEHPQYIATQYGFLPQQGMMPTRHIQTQGQYTQYDPYGYGMSPVQMSQLDPRLANQAHYSMNSTLSGDFQQFSRRASEPATVPSFPRGPPRKPKQSGHALWVGNLPPAATVIDLKDHFSRDATKDIESLFLISKSNCAFVNYRTEAACTAAMNRFHDSRFNGVRLVCRLRRGAATSSSATSASAPDVLETPSSSGTQAGASTPTVVEEEMSSPTIVGGRQSSITTQQPATLPGVIDTTQRMPEKFFIVKSLTVQDLEASVRNGIWATQSHNEAVLNRAYEDADNVYLIFSANKSGEYFGYARMSSAISGDPVNLSTAPDQDDSLSTGSPQSIPTPATATAPRGRIIDDSARGTIFWEALQCDEDDDDESPEKDTGESSSGQNWGRQFSIEWLSTSRLPFYRTRGLRNAYNANREIKIARDGTEIEPSVGRRLVQMFHQRPSPGSAQTQPGMAFR